MAGIRVLVGTDGADGLVLRQNKAAFAAAGRPVQMPAIRSLKIEPVVLWHCGLFCFLIHDFLAVGNTGYEKAVFSWEILNAEPEL